MVRNTMGGKKAKKMKNGGPIKRDTIYPDKDQYYAVVEKFYSHSNIDIYYVDVDKDDNPILILGSGVIRGKIIKRIHTVNAGDIFIISKRDFETVKLKPTLDILHSYKPQERNLIIPKLHKLLKFYINSQVINNKPSNNEDDDDNDNDNILFTREQKEHKKIKINNGLKNNSITNSYLTDDDLNYCNTKLQKHNINNYSDNDE
jgi:hypothetical protein